MTSTAHTRKLRLLIALLALGALGAPASASAIDAPSATEQWRVANADTVQTSTDYELHNSKGGQMGYDERRFGVSLGFVGHGGGHFQFKPKGATPRVRDHRVRTVLEDEPLALYNTKTKQYLGVGFPVFGISLKWSKVPLYDWRLRDIKGPRFALYGNGDYLVHGHRTVGINLKWYRDTLPKPEPKPTPTGPKEFSVALQRQQIVQGHIPYLGQFGGPLDKGKITKIQNASFDMTLLMVKRGRSTEQCGDPSATVRVAPRAFMTSDQMKEWFSATPVRFPTAFVACISGPRLVDTTFLNITYEND